MMKTGKTIRLLSFLLMLCMVLSLLPASAMAQKPTESITELPVQELQEDQTQITYSDASVVFDQLDALMPENAGEKTVTLRRGGNVAEALELVLLVYDNNANYGQDYQLRYNGELISKVDGATSVYNAFRDGGTLTDGLLFDMSATYQAQVAEETGETAEEISAAQMLSQLDELGALAARIPVTFGAGESVVTLTVELLDDALREYEESFLMAVLDAQGEVVEQAQLLLAIEDNEEAPTVAVSFDCAYELVADSETGLAELSFRRTGDLATSTLAVLLMNGEALGYVDFAPYQDKQTVWVVPGNYTLAPGSDHSVTGESVTVLSTDGSVTVPEGADPELDAIPNAYASMGSQETKAWSIPSWFPEWAKNTSTVETYDYIAYMGSTSNAIFKTGNSSGVGRWNMFNDGGNEHCIETDGTGSRIKKGWRNVHSVKQDYDMTGIESLEITACITGLDYDNQVIIGFDKVTSSGRTEVGRTTKDNGSNSSVTVIYTLPENCQDKGMVFVENKDPSKSDDGCNMYIPNGFKANKRTYRFVISNPDDMYYRGIGYVDISIQNASSSIFTKMGSGSNVTIAYQVEGDLPVKLVGYKIRNMSTFVTSGIIPISGSSFTFDRSFLQKYESTYCANTQDGSTTYETFEIIPVFEKIPVTVELEDAILGTISIRDYTAGTQLYVGERIIIDGNPSTGTTFSGVYYKNYKNISSSTFTSGTIDASSTGAVTIDLGKYDKIVLQGSFRTSKDRLVVNYAETVSSKRHGKLGFKDGVVIQPSEYVKGDYFPLIAQPDNGYITRWQSDGRYYYGNTFYYQLDGNANHNWITVEFVPESSLTVKTGTVSGTLYVYDVELRSSGESKMMLTGNNYSVFSDKEYSGVSDANGRYTLENFTAVEGGTYSVMVLYRDMVGYATFVPFGSSSVPQDRDVEMSQFAAGSIYPSEVSISLGYVTASQNVVQVRPTDTGDITVQVTNEAGDKGTVTEVELVFLSTRGADYGNELARITLDYNEQLTLENDSGLYSYWTYNVTDPSVLPVQSRMYVSVTADKVYASADASGNVSTATGTITSGLVNSGYEFIQAITDTSIPVQQSIPDLPGAQNANLSEDNRNALEIPLIGNADFSLTSLSGGYFVQRVVNGTTYLICGYSLTPVYGVGDLASKYDGAVKTQAAIKAQSEANAKAMSGSADMESILLGNGNYTPSAQPQKKAPSPWSVQPAFMMKLALTPGVDAEGNDKVYVTGFEMALGFDAFCRKNIPFSVYGVPFYICFAVSIEALAQGQFYYEPGTAEAGSDLTLSLYEMCQEPGAMDTAVSSAENFIAAPILSLGLKAGVGYNCFLGVYVDGTVSMPMIFQFNPSFGVAGEVGFKLSVGADLVFFTANFTAINPTAPFGDDELYEELLAVQGYAAADPSKHKITADGTNTRILSAEDETPTLEEMLDNLSFSLMERPENGTNLLRSGTVDSTTLAENVFKNTNVQLIQLENGNIMALFLEDNGEEGLNYLSAAYAISEDDGLTWSNINHVNSNIGQANTSLQFDVNAYPLEDRILITWSEADFDTLLEDVDVNNLSEAQIANVMNAMNLHGRFFDISTGEAMGEAFTIAEHSTVACGALDAVQNGENVYVYYQRNSFPITEDVTVTDLMNTERTVAMARANVNDASNWESTPIRAMNENGQQYRITEVEPFVHDGVMGELLVIDRNGLLATYNEEDGSWTADNEDRQLYLRTYDFAEDGTPQPTALLPITDAEDCAQSPQVVSNDDYLHLFWNQNGEVVYLTDFIATYEDHEDIQASAILLKNSDNSITVVAQESVAGNQITGSETMHVGTAFSASMADDGNVLLSWIGEDLEDQNLIAAEEIYGVILNTVTNAEALVRSGDEGMGDSGNENVYQLWAVGAPIALTDADSLIGALDSLCLESGKDSTFLLAFTKLNATLRTEVTSADLLAVQSVDAPKVVLEGVSAPAYPLPGSEMAVHATVANYGLEPLTGAKFTVSGIGETVTVEYTKAILPGESATVELVVAVPEDFSQTTELVVTVCGLEGQEEYADSGKTTVCYGPYFALEEMSDLISIPNSVDCEAITRVKNIGNASGKPTLTFTNTIYGGSEAYKEYVFDSGVTVEPGEEVTLTYVLEDTLMNKEKTANLVVATGEGYDQRMDSLMPVPVIQTPEETEVTVPIEEIFTDVEDHWAKDAIEFVYYEGLMNGMSDTTFEPETTTSRAMLVTVLYRMSGESVAAGENPFTDVREDYWYTDAILWAAENGIVNGYGGNLFGPEDPVTREQMAAIFYRYAAYMGYDTAPRADLNGFKDYKTVSAYAIEPMSWANAVGLINGVTTDTLCPLANATRAQIATILRRFCQLQ